MIFYDDIILQVKITIFISESYQEYRSFQTSTIIKAAKPKSINTKVLMQLSNFRPRDSISICSYLIAGLILSHTSAFSKLILHCVCFANESQRVNGTLLLHPLVMAYTLFICSNYLAERDSTQSQAEFPYLQQYQTSNK